MPVHLANDEVQVRMKNQRAGAPGETKQDGRTECPRREPTGGKILGQLSLDKSIPMEVLLLLLSVMQMRKLNVCKTHIQATSK